MGNCVGRGEGYVLPHDRHKWIAKYGHQVVRGLLDCENSNLLVFNKRAAATNTAFYCHRNLYNTVFDPSFPLPPEPRLIDPKLVEKLGVERKLSKAAAVAPIEPEARFAGDLKEQKREASLPRVQRVKSVKERSTSLKRDGHRSSATDLNVYVVTWNMNGKVPGSNFANLLEVSEDKYDFFIVGLQEAPNFDAKRLISETLGEKYCLIQASVLMSLQLFIFAKRSLKPHISGAKVDKLWEKRLSGAFGAQKGSAAVRLRFKDKTLLFITSHFPPHECNLEARNAQYTRICQSVFARSTPSCSCVQPTTLSDDIDCRVPGVTNLVEEADVVVWLGDLNYRVELPRSSVHNLIKHKMHELWAKDQLSKALRKGQVFKGFQEGPLLFPPTYKYDVGTDNYDTSSKERVPSWTDRILYKVSTVRAELRGYDAISSLKTSDHRPVKAHLAFKNLL